MASRSTRHAAAASADTAAGMPAPLTVLSDMTRQQLTMMTEAACAVLGSSEALGRIQQQAAHQASVRHQAAAQSLRSEVEPMEVLSIQSDLMRQDMQEAAQYWAQLASTVMRGQLDMMGRMGNILNAGAPGMGPFESWRSAMAASADPAHSRTDVH